MWKKESFIIWLAMIGLEYWYILSANGRAKQVADIKCFTSAKESGSAKGEYWVPRPFASSHLVLFYTFPQKLSAVTTICSGHSIWTITIPTSGMAQPIVRGYRYTLAPMPYHTISVWTWKPCSCHHSRYIHLWNYQTCAPGPWLNTIDSVNRSRVPQTSQTW